MLDSNKVQELVNKMSDLIADYQSLIDDFPCSADELIPNEREAWDEIQTLASELGLVI